MLNSTNKGEIRGNKYVGGIAGQIDGDYVVENCYNISRINVETGVAGIVGGRQSQASKLASMVNCYSIGEITGNYNIGDILGLEEERKESIINCYTKNDTFTASDLGNAFKEDTENKNNGYPILQWQ